MQPDLFHISRHTHVEKQPEVTLSSTAASSSSSSAEVKSNMHENPAKSVFDSIKLAPVIADPRFLDKYSLLIRNQAHPRNGWKSEQWTKPQDVMCDLCGQLRQEVSRISTMVGQFTPSTTFPGKLKVTVEGSYCSVQCEKWATLRSRKNLSEFLPNQSRMYMQVYGISPVVKVGLDPERIERFCTGHHSITQEEYDRRLTFIRQTLDESKYEFQYVPVQETTELLKWPGPAVDAKDQKKELEIDLRARLSTSKTNEKPNDVPTVVKPNAFEGLDVFYKYATDDPIDPEGNDQDCIVSS